MNEYYISLIKASLIIMLQGTSVWKYKLWTSPQTHPKKKLCLFRIISQIEQI